MIYLFFKIVLWLLLAAFLGFLIGWHLHKYLNREKPKKTSLKNVKDNLQKINGIGSILESKLNQLGIDRFEQIAHWDKTEIEKISKHIGPFSNRIEKDKWIIQAKTLMKT